MSKAQKEGSGNRVKEYVSETKLEMKKVTWPDRASVARASIIILVIVVLTTLYITGVDILFSRLFSFLRTVT